MRYAVDQVPDDPAHLQATLNRIAATNGRVISTIWLPSRPGGGTYFSAGYVVISEYSE